MKKIFILACALTIVSSVVNAAPVAVDRDSSKTPVAVNEKVNNEGIKNPPTKEEIIKHRMAKEAAFDEKLGLTDAQKIKAKELRLQAQQKMKPIIEEIKAKKQEAKMVKLSRISTQMQEEKLAKIDKEIAVLKKKANEIRKQNMKAFESILTADQKKILKQMKKEGRKNFEKRHEKHQRINQDFESNKMPLEK